MSTGYNKTAWQDGDIITADKMNNIENGIKDVEDTIGELKENLSDLQEVSDTKAAAIYETASGEIASFSDGADDLPMKSCVVKMEPIQDLHGYDSPWPAGGGKNLADTRNRDVSIAGFALYQMPMVLYRFLVLGILRLVGSHLSVLPISRRATMSFRRTAHISHAL